MPVPADPIADILRGVQASDRVRAAAWDAYYQASDQADLEKRLRDLPIPNEAKAQLWDAKGGVTAGAQPTSEPSRTWGDTAKDVGIGFAKGAAHTALDAGALVRRIPFIGPALNTTGNALGGAVGQVVYGTKAEPVTSDQAFAQARADTAYRNGPQMLGGALETATELIAPGILVKNAVPTTAKAGEKFRDVMSAARDVPVDVNAPGEVALRIQELADRGGSMPMAVRKFLGRITNPDAGPLTYEEARDFASNISRLSANEYQRLTPVIAREVANLRVTLNGSVADAAQQAGKLNEYRAAMKEYARAMRLRDAIGAVAEGAKKSLPYASAAGAGYWLTSQLKHLLGGGE